jgi:hypothetical protein
MGFRTGSEQGCDPLNVLGLLHLGNYCKFLHPYLSP